MRGEVDPQRGMFSYVDLESRIPASHPIRKIRCVVDKALVTLSPEFDQYYSEFGRVSIPPEMLLRAKFYKSSTRSAPSVSWLNALTTTCCSAGL